MVYRVRWFDHAAGAVQEELAEAASPAEVAQRYARAGRTVLRTERVRRWASGPMGGERLDIAWWCRELRTLLAAGMTIVEAIETLHAQALGPARASLHARLIGLLREGRTLSSAMAETAAFPDVLIAGVRASERTSGLVPALDDYLRYHDVLAKLRRQLVNAAIYPSVVLSLGMVIVAFLLMFVMPRFARMYGELHGPVSTVTRMLVGFSQLLSTHGSELALALGAVVAVVVVAWRQGLVHRLGERVVEQVPVLRRAADHFRLAKLYQSIGLLFKGGYSLDDALAQCERLGLGPRLAVAVVEARAAILRGQRVSVSLQSASLTDPVSMRLLAVGERTGEFHVILSTIAERHAAEFVGFVERATRIVEPVLLLVVALLVGGIVVGMYMPVFDIASSVR
ncbi:type II secretion system F family protein [Aquincola sp. MAHUQ-54]|uniref:Type II secretion system F family protein n=1 Tax=Aquincola agrisoli TaxID=3119538 RepID=A0AAW9Q848_9BURK